jgi:hypothetical protein
MHDVVRACHASGRTRAARARRGTGGPSGPSVVPGVPLLVTIASFWTMPGGWFPLAGVPTAAHHWSPLRRTSQRLAAHAARAPVMWLTPRPLN